jgi:hypothetical protein
VSEPEASTSEEHIRLCCLEFAYNLEPTTTHEWLHIAHQLAEFVLHNATPADLADDDANVVPMKKPKKKA